MPFLEREGASNSITLHLIEETMFVRNTSQRASSLTVLSDQGEARLWVQVPSH